jgi:glutamine synthetase
MGDCAINPYQAVAVVLQAARLDVAGSIQLQPAEDLVGLENAQKRRHIPSGLDKSSDALDKDVMLRQISPVFTFPVCPLTLLSERCL